MQDDKSFLALLGNKKTKSRYVEEKRIAVREAKILYERQKENLQHDLEEGIHQDREHRDILNACIFPFVNRDSPPFKLGYHFLRASPLSEMNIENMDFLIVNSSANPLAIVGECKGSAEDPDAIVSQTQSRISLVTQYREYIERKYIERVRVRLNLFWASFRYMLWKQQKVSSGKSLP